MKQNKTHYSNLLHFICYLFIFCVQINNIFASEILDTAPLLKSLNLRKELIQNKNIITNNIAVLLEQYFKEVDESNIKLNEIMFKNQLEETDILKGLDFKTLDATLTKVDNEYTSIKENEFFRAQKFVIDLRAKTDELIKDINPNLQQYLSPINDYGQRVNIINYSDFFNEINAFFSSKIDNYIENSTNLKGTTIKYSDVVYFNINIGINNSHFYFKKINETTTRANNYFSEFGIINMVIKFSDYLKWSINIGSDYNHSFKDDSRLFKTNDKLFLGYFGTNFDFNFSNLSQVTFGYVYTTNLKNKLNNEHTIKFDTNYNIVFLKLKQNYTKHIIGNNESSFFLKEKFIYHNFKSNLRMDGNQINKHDSLYCSSIELNAGINQEISSIFNKVTLNAFSQLSFNSTLDFSTIQNQKFKDLYLEFGIQFTFLKKLNTLLYFSKGLNNAKTNTFLFKINFEI